MIRVLVKRILCGILLHVIVKNDEYLVLKIAHVKKGLIGELVLECEDEILNATETSLEHIYWPVIFL